MELKKLIPTILLLTAIPCTIFAQPTVTSDTRFARGATMAFGRIKSAVTNGGPTITKRGFCIAENPNPTIDDSVSTKTLSNNGTIYYFVNLKPATKYYMRAYATNQSGVTGYGEVIKFYTLPKGNVTYGYNNGGSSAENTRINNALIQACDLFSNLTSIKKHFDVGYGSGTPTADCNYRDTPWMNVGPNQSYQKTGTIMHEMQHGLGVISYSTQWCGSILRSGNGTGYWLGDRVSEFLDFWDNTTGSRLNGDTQHMWPYGINGAQEDDGTLKAAKLPAEGDVIITSKNITMQTIDAEVADKKYKDTGLAKDGSITIRSKSIGLSNINTTDVEADDKGKVTKATYKPEGEILLFSKQVQISSMESKLDGDKVEETALAKDSVFSVRAEKMSLSAADHEGKAAGQATINAKQVTVSAMNVDPKTKKFKEVAQGGSIEVYAEKQTVVAKKDLAIHGEETAQLTSTKKLLVNGKETTEVKQDDKNLLTLSGGNTDLSGGKVTISGDTTVKALTSPLVSAEKLEVKSAFKSSNISDGVFVGTKDTSTASSKIEMKKEAADVNKEALDGGAATEKNQGDALGHMAGDAVNNVLGIALEVGFKKPGEEKKS